MIQWYPGHMTKAKREIGQKLSLADVVIEVLDARAPCATSNPDFIALFGNKPRVVVLNKEDLAEPMANAKWTTHFAKQGIIAVPFCAVRSGKTAQLIHSVEKATAPLRTRWADKGAVRCVRAMITGIPNVGKSSIINALSHQKRAKVGASPGVTRGQQWIRLSDTMELLDTPGVLWPKFEDQNIARHLACINAIRDEVLEHLPLAQSFVDELKQIRPGLLTSRYNIDETAQSLQILSDIAKNRGCIVRGGQLDIERAATMLIEEFRSGKLGRITLEIPKDGTDDAAKGI